MFVEVIFDPELLHIFNKSVKAHILYSRITVVCMSDFKISAALEGHGDDVSTDLPPGTDSGLNSSTNCSS